MQTNFRNVYKDWSGQKFGDWHIHGRLRIVSHSPSWTATCMVCNHDFVVTSHQLRRKYNMPKGCSNCNFTKNHFTRSSSEEE